VRLIENRGGNGGPQGVGVPRCDFFRLTALLYYYRQNRREVQRAVENYGRSSCQTPDVRRQRRHGGSSRRRSANESV